MLTDYRDLQYLQLINKSSKLFEYLNGLGAIYWPGQDGDTTARANIATYNGTHSNVTYGNAGAGNIPRSIGYVSSSGSDTDVLSASLTSLFNLNAGTLFAFSKVASGANTDGQTRMLMAFGDGTTTNRIELQKNGTNDKLSVYVKLSNTTFANWTVDYDAAKWFMLAVTFDDPATETYGYLNGSVFESNTSSSAPMNAALSKAYIGSYDGTSFNYDGDIAYGGYVPRALSANEIANIYKKAGI
jgi:hypothetical protein